MNPSSRMNRKSMVTLCVLAASALFAADSLANAPAGHFTVSNGVVTDTLTGLQWQQTISDSTFTFATAASYCDGLSYGGLTDWRVPSVKELVTLVDYTQSPATDTVAFPSTPQVQFWTSSMIVDPTGTYGYDVVFDHGNASMSPQTTLMRTRCVR